MKVEYDPKHDLLNIDFLPDMEVVDSMEIDGIIFDYGQDRSIVSIEILDAGKRTKHSPLEQLEFSVTKSEG